jgi:hypothetical protein
MIIFTVIGGVDNSQPCVPTNAITQGQANPYTPHKYEDLTECPCPYLDRFSAHGRGIREAYEDAVVTAIGILQ